VAQPFPSTVKASVLDAKHPDWTSNAGTWETVSLLCEGGAHLKSKAGLFLIRRPKEPNEVYEARLQMFTYQNILGTIAGWYESALFRRDPEIDLPAEDAFLKGFLENCDRQGTTFVDLFRRVFRYMLLYQNAYVLLDLPARVSTPENYAEQVAAGLLDPYLVAYAPLNIINWKMDPWGNLEWAVIATEHIEQGFLADVAVCIERWNYFSTQEFAVYERRTKVGEREKKDEAVLLDSGIHALAAAKRVPICRLSIADTLWIGNRTHLQLIDHINTDNTYKWALFVANLAMPVIITDDEITNVTLSELGYFKLGKGSSVSYAEPGGVSFERSAQRLDSLREEAYRQAYLQAQGRSAAATPAMQSGYSKELDMMPAHDVLNDFGDRVRAGMKSVLRDVLTARGGLLGKADDAEPITVRGFSFDEADTEKEVLDTEAVRRLALPSDTLDLILAKRVATAALGDVEQSVRDKVMKELESAPPKSDRDAAEKEERLKEMENAMGGAAAGGFGGE